MVFVAAYESVVIRSGQQSSASSIVTYPIVHTIFQHHLCDKVGASVVNEAMYINGTSSIMQCSLSMIG